MFIDVPSSRSPNARRRAHRLLLYRYAVQHPEAEVRFLRRAYAHGAGGRGPKPTRLKEDFAGTAAVAAAWVGMDEDHRAIAVEHHGPTARWAERAARDTLGRRAIDLHVVEADVHELTTPRVDVVAALNFSTFAFHDREALTRYFRHARRSLRPNGVLVIDAYGGPGAMRVQTQVRRVAPPPNSGLSSFEYAWEQRAFDHATHRTDCRIHFHVGDSGHATWRRNAFRYDWRLWSLPELRELALAAGFRAAQVWCDRFDEKPGRSDGLFRPRRKIPAREDWVAYLVARR